MTEKVCQDGYKRVSTGGFLPSRVALWVLVVGIMLNSASVEPGTGQSLATMTLPLFFYILNSPLDTFIRDQSEKGEFLNMNFLKQK